MIPPEVPLKYVNAAEALLELASAFIPPTARESPDFDASAPISSIAQESADLDANAPISLAQKRYQILIDQLPAATFMAWFEKGRCELYVSSHIERLLGYTATEWTEDPILWYERLYHEDRERWNEQFSRTISNTEPFKGDYRFLAKDGRLVWIHGEVEILRDESGRPFMHGIGYDITELKLVEENLRQAHDKEQHANRAKGEFLSRTSHELRTPLNGIMGFAEFLIGGKTGALNPKQKEYLQDIYNCGEHLLGLINNVLDFAKIEAGKMDLKPTSFSIRAVVESVCAGLLPVARKKNIQVDIAVSPELREVTLDEQKVKQILYNLLSNAIKFTENDGAVKISAEAHNGQSFKLVIKDTGVGIKTEDLPRLFREFEQLETGNSRRYEGTGLGLALTKSFVELQGGSISVESVYGHGSTFSVVLPNQIPEDRS